MGAARKRVPVLFITQRWSENTCVARLHGVHVHMQNVIVSRRHRRPRPPRGPRRPRRPPAALAEDGGGLAEEGGLVVGGEGGEGGARV